MTEGWLKCTGATETFYLVRVKPRRWTTQGGLSLGVHKAVVMTEAEAAEIIADCLRREPNKESRFAYELVTPWC